MRRRKQNGSSGPLAVLALALAVGACGRRDARPSVVLVTLDTTRADAVGAPGITPRLDAFAAGATRFVEARTTAPMTLPAHASMLTGLYPPRHGVRDNGPMFLPSAARTLAEEARAAGYETAAFVSALALDRAFGLDQGFEVYDQPTADAAASTGTHGERADAETVGAAIAWLRARESDRPLFLWVHLFDPHAPYEPAPRFLEQAGGDAYLGEVASLDAAFGELLDALAEQGLFEDAVVAVAGDHGEALFEHGEPTHALLCYDSTLRVPLLVRDVGRGLAGGASDAVASVADLFPTLLAALGRPVPRELDGIDLASAPPDGRGLYFETYSGFRAFGWSPLAGWLDARGKYVHGARPEFFEPRVDVGEERDLYEPGAPRFDAYRAAIADVLARPSLPADERSAVPSDALEAIAALGYATSPELSTSEFPDPLAPTDRPPPQERMEEFVAFDAAEKVMEAGRPREAIPLLEQVLESNARNPWALDLLARALVEVGDHARALALLERRLELAPELVATHRGIAACLEALGREPERARGHLRRAMWLMAEAHERRGENELAERYRELLERAAAQERTGGGG